MEDKGVLADRRQIRAFLDSIPDAAIVVDRAGGIVAANELTTAMLGWPIDELEGKSLEELIPERFRADHTGHVARYFESPKTRRMSMDVNLFARTREGGEVPVQISLGPWAGEGVDGVIASIRDFSEHRGVELALRASEERFRLVTEHTADVIQVANVRKGEIKFSDDVYDLLGYSRREFPMDVSGWLGLIHPDDRDRIQEEVDRLIAGDASVWNFEYRILAADGSYHYWHDRGTVTDYFEDGSFNICVGAALDITERVESQTVLAQKVEDLDRLAELLRAVLGSIIDSLAVLDRAGRIIAVNEAWIRFAEENGADEATRVGIGLNYLDSCQMTADEEDPEVGLALAGIQSVLDGSRSTFKLDYPCHSTSEERWYMLTATCLEGREQGAVVAHRDITERVQRRKQLESAFEEVKSLKDRLSEENIYLQEEIQGAVDSEEIIGESPSWLRVLNQVNLVANTESAVLLTGETGTGKDIVARALHTASKRSDRPMIRVNCAALPSTLIESELFGHRRGAFTGADVARKGRFAIADQGTIFLDEVGELPLELQAKLLHVLQSGEFEPVGSSRTQSADVRVIAATNRNLLEAAQDGRFRSDLYYRLAVFPIDLPPLRDRQDDIPLLATYFLARHAAKHARPIHKISPKMMETLVNYEWPGNVRELENTIERAVIISHADSLDLESAFFTQASVQRSTNRGSESSIPNPAAATRHASSPGATLKEMERSHITGVLESCGWVVKGRGKAAEILGLKESTLRSRMKKLGIQRPGRTRKG